MLFVVEWMWIEPPADETFLRDVVHNHGQHIADDTEECCGENDSLGLELVDGS